ncbi:MAG: glutamine-hydrolyzing carbamoyl-phosphate synthase small subunit [Bacillota bacterium]
MTARLILEDGTLFEGKSCGATGEAWGEVVFNTSMTGYQEVLTDPSYCGQIVSMTFPLIGNYGINEEDFESRSPFVRGFIMRECCRIPSNWRSCMTLPEYLEQNNIVAMEGMDTRALTRYIREKGTMRGLITTRETPYAELLERVRKTPTISEQDLISSVTTPEPYTWENKGPHVVIIDLGLKLSIGRSLHNMGCRVTVIPVSLTATEILALKPDAIVLSNGPGNPERATGTIKMLTELLGHLPVLGICLGHQLLALALGAKTYKLKFGHRGANHPVKDLLRNRVYITSQNHGFAVDESSLPPELKMTHRNVNDGTVEGFRNEKLKLISIQYHPEAFPGPMDSRYLFDEFLAYI